MTSPAHTSRTLWLLAIGLILIAVAAGALKEVLIGMGVGVLWGLAIVGYYLWRNHRNGPRPRLPSPGRPGY